ETDDVAAGQSRNRLKSVSVDYRHYIRWEEYLKQFTDIAWRQCAMFGNEVSGSTYSHIACSSHDHAAIRLALGQSGPPQDPSPDAAAAPGRAGLGAARGRGGADDPAGRLQAVGRDGRTAGRAAVRPPCPRRAADLVRTGADPSREIGRAHV